MRPSNGDDDRPWFIAVAASAGGIPAQQTVPGGLPADTRVAVVVAEHRK
jgi:chemotaxis response regulator CheB